ncbi:hypothetical protein AL346_00015 [Chelatococcus sp. CO-6]|nr:hypothetical protein AL346_00015 [Chelatococcus sp. CO-6]
MSLLTSKDVAAALGVDTRTVQSWVRRGALVPDSITLGGHARYSPETVEELKSKCLERNGISPGSTPGAVSTTSSGASAASMLPAGSGRQLSASAFARATRTKRKLASLPSSRKGKTSCAPLPSVEEMLA